MRKKTAKWIKRTHVFRRDEYVCSACGCITARPGRTCPGCGAAMKGSKYDPNWVDEMERLVAAHQGVFAKECAEPERCLPDAKVCDIGDARLNLDAEGRYYPCDGFHGAIIGNARTDSLWEV